MKVKRTMKKKNRGQPQKKTQRPRAWIMNLGTVEHEPQAAARKELATRAAEAMTRNQRQTRLRTRGAAMTAKRFRRMMRMTDPKPRVEKAKGRQLKATRPTGAMQEAVNLTSPWRDARVGATPTHGVAMNVSGPMVIGASATASFCLWEDMGPQCRTYLRTPNKENHSDGTA